MTEKSSSNEDKGDSNLVMRTLDPWLESKKASNTLIIFGILLVAIPVIGIGVATTRLVRPIDLIPVSIPVPFAAPPAPSLQADGRIFTCVGAKTINAFFSGNLVDLVLSDGRTLSLPETGSGLYENPDGSFVFEDTGNTATIVEQKIETYKNCDS